MSESESLETFVRWWMWSLTAWVPVLLAAIVFVYVFAAVMAHR